MMRSSLVRLALCSIVLFAAGRCAEPPAADSTPAAPATAVAAGSATLRADLRALEETYARFRATQVSNPAYALTLDVSAPGDDFSGEVQIDFTLAADNDSPLTIDFDSGEILALEVNGEALAPDYTRWFLTIPATALQPGDNTVRISWARPYATDGAGLHKFTDPENGEVYLYTNFEPYDTNRLFPHFDQPDLKAPLTLQVTAPSAWQVIANTRESATEGRGDNLVWHFPASQPISSYVYAMHAGPFRVWEDQAGDIPLRLFVRNSMAGFVDTAEWFEPTRKSFAFFQEWFDVPYPFGKYDQVIVPDFNAGAMENVAAVTFSERYLSRGVRGVAQKRSLASVIAHEMAHMWFGDLVTMRWWNGLWLNESFATYMANLALEASGDFDNVWDSFYLSNKLWAYETDDLVTTHPIELSVPTTADAFTNFDGITYGKGGSVLKQLPYLIGAEEFRLGISNYLKQHSWGNTDLDDFVSALAAASGMDLSEWEQQWLHTSGVNTLIVDFTCDPDALGGLQLRQSAPALATADPLLRSQRTQIGLYDFNGDILEPAAVVGVTYSGAVTEVAVPSALPCPQLVLPNEDDWAYFKIELDPVTEATLRDHINAIANPTTRLMLWQALWDGVLDARLPLDAYVDFVLRNAGAEMNDNVLRHLTGTLGSAFSYLRLFGGHDDLLLRMEAFVREQAHAATADSEPQKIWVDTLLQRSFSEAGLDHLQQLLEGTQAFEGLPIDQDRRWAIVRNLSRHAHPFAAALLAAERERDPSDSGVNAALAAEASQPNAQTKARWIDVILDQSGQYKLATLRTVMAALFPPEQTALLEQQRERLLAAVPTINAEASQEFVGEYTAYFSTGTCTADSVARLAQANRDFAGMQPLVVKAYLIHHQDDERCTRMRAALDR